MKFKIKIVYPKENGNISLCYDKQRDHIKLIEIGSYNVYTKSFEYLFLKNFNKKNVNTKNFSCIV